MTEMEKNYFLLSLRNSPAIWELFTQTQKLRPSLTRVQNFRTALYLAIDFKADFSDLSKRTFKYNPLDDSAPEFIQLRVDKKVWQQLIDSIRDSLHLQRVSTSYAVKLVLLNYIEMLETESKPFNADEDIPEMFQILSKMSMQDINCDELKQIRKILFKWREKR